jgi:hypothetical protein
MSVRRPQSEPEPPPVIAVMPSAPVPEIAAPSSVIYSAPLPTAPAPPPPPIQLAPAIRTVSSVRTGTGRRLSIHVVVAIAVGTLITVALAAFGLKFFSLREVPEFALLYATNGVHEPPRNPGPPLRDIGEFVAYLRSNIFDGAVLEEYRYWNFDRSPPEDEYTVVLRMPVNGMVPPEKDRPPREDDYKVSDELQRQREEASEKLSEFGPTPRILSSGRISTPNEEMFERAKQHSIEIDALIRKESEKDYQKMVQDYERLWKPWTPDLPRGYVPHMARARGLHWKNSICITLSGDANADVDAIHPSDPYGAFAFRSYLIWGDKRLIEQAKRHLRAL